jgi:hypothetical protein
MGAAATVAAALFLAITAFQAALTLGAALVVLAELSPASNARSPRACPNY